MFLFLCSVLLFVVRDVCFFVYGGLVQKELDEYVKEWNAHRLRRNNKALCPSGIVSVLYHHPTLFGARQCLVPLSEAHVNEVAHANRADAVRLDRLSSEFRSLLEALTERLMGDHPVTPSNASFLYKALVDLVS